MTIPKGSPQNIQYIYPVQIAPQEDKNFFEGLMWGVTGIQSAIQGIASVGAALTLDAMALGALSFAEKPGQTLVGAVGLAALNCLAYYIIKAEFSIASKSFTHMKNTIL